MQQVELQKSLFHSGATQLNRSHVHFQLHSRCTVMCLFLSLLTYFIHRDCVILYCLYLQWVVFKLYSSYAFYMHLLEFVPGATQPERWIFGCSVMNAQHCLTESMIYKHCLVYSLRLLFDTSRGVRGFVNVVQSQYEKTGDPFKKRVLAIVKNCDNKGIRDIAC